MSEPTTSTPDLLHPLIYVGVELRVPFSPRLESGDLAEHLVRSLPGNLVLRQENRGRFIQSAGEVTVVQEKGWRLIDRESTNAFVVTPTSLTYETTRYPGFEVVLERIREFLVAIADFASPVGVERLGLRYVNEIRPGSQVTQFSEWGRWIQPEIIDTALGATRAFGSDPAASRSQLSALEQQLKFDLPNHRQLVLRMASLDGPGVIGNQPLKRWSNPAPGVFFVVDLDSFWPRDLTPQIRDFDVDDICTLAGLLHDPVKDLFHWAVTEEYRSQTIRTTKDR
jgi:uncharacterized protein (TIGR04255 family)